MSDYKRIYNKLNSILNAFSDDTDDTAELQERVDKLIDIYINELNNYKVKIEENTLILQAQFEEISRTYEELTTVLDISKMVFSVKDPRLAIENVVTRLKDVINFRNIVVGEFILNDDYHDFNLLYSEFLDADLNILPLLNIMNRTKPIKTILKERDEINDYPDSMLLVPIKSQIKIWGFLLLYGKKDRSIFLASDKKILESVAEQLAFGFDTMNYLKERIKQQKMDEQLKLAKEIQESLLPKTLPTFEKIQLSTFYRSAFDVGGDYYDALKLSETKLFAILADVSGKGVPAALIMSSLKGVVRSKVENAADLGEVVNYINNFLSRSLPSDRFVTAIFVLVDSENKTLQVINAGHNESPFFIDGKFYSSKAGGLPLGILEDNAYSPEKFEYTEDLVFFTYTDGLTEARNPKKDEYGWERLQSLMQLIKRDNTDVIVNSIIDSVDTFVENAEQHDDTTLLAIKSF
ncbi:MAG TPA: SpoIIE family protein phosphatase [Petrotogaceae bacterium]|jgi:sigma-B regulation protein RsbU (phosphoserine phosphatase)|nr:SpoIIE family protein phosphatase [Petrotogaceae bacterium]HNV05160.1 SpoIIE family protein phosphatase [Petrotogaceae bacterium]HNY36450.1 SpoIIE family protein phosphatase [Petrotogaceae bacterium]HOG34444.1 SpoIIE family protein phosphatase [Petrotogaceae bacterium]HPO26497.1 SpoIIE family protein phosphatase [Petrotogaceae bacterium]